MEVLQEISEGLQQGDADKVAESVQKARENYVEQKRNQRYFF